MQELVDRFYTSLATGEIKKLFKKLLSYNCIILDEIGYLPLDKKAANYLFQLISKCYERKSLIVSSNSTLTPKNQNLPIFGHFSPVISDVPTTFFPSSSTRGGTAMPAALNPK